MENNIFTINGFFTTTEFNSYSENVQKLISRLFENLKTEEIGFVVKVRKGVHKVIVIAYDKKPTGNIATIYIHEEHIRVERPDKLTWPLKNIMEVDSYDYMPLIERYHKLNIPKKQQSIYIHQDILENIELIAKKENKTMNEVIEFYLREKTAGWFLNIRHRLEFINLLRQADMYRNDIGPLDEEKSRLLIFCYIIAAYQAEYELLGGSKVQLITEGNRVNIDSSNPIEVEVSLNPAYVFALAIFHREDFIPSLEYMDEQLFRLASNAMRLLKQNKDNTINIDSPEIIVKFQRKVIEAPSINY